MKDFQLQRLGLIMEPEPGNTLEVEGVLNPTAVRGPDGQLYLFPRLVAKGNYSRIGIARVTFNDAGEGVEFNDVDNKDSLLFPVAIPDPNGQPSMAIIHRPLFPGTGPDETLHCRIPRVVDILRESIWISYHSLVEDACDKHHQLCHFDKHDRLATPISAWETLKIGGGTPPVLTKHGWLMVYHGVSEVREAGNDSGKLCYSAGVMVLSKEHPRKILYRSSEPVLTPLLPQERHGMISNVVFPTGIDRRDDLGSPDRFDVYYGMAENRIGVARLDVPETLSKEEVCDSDL